MPRHSQLLPPDGHNVTALVLAGGRGTRMEGRDKGLQPFRGIPLAQHALLRIQRTVHHRMVNANRNIDVYLSFGAPVQQDHTADYPGPLAGIHAGLCAIQTPYLLTLPCDVPQFPLDLLSRLAQPFEQHPELMLTVAASPSGPQPVFSLMRAEALQHLNHFLAQGQRKMHDWHARLAHVVVQFEDESAFHNINTLDELQALERH